MEKLLELLEQDCTMPVSALAGRERGRGQSRHSEI